VPTPVSNPAGVTVTAVAAGYVDSFALSSTGAVYAWGYNGLGELGNGGTANASTPTLVKLPAGVTATGINVGFGHALASTSTGAVYAWGYNNVGQVGDGTVVSRVNPVLVKLPAGVTATSVSAGYAHSLAVTAAGAVYAWGYNATGQLGNGTKTNSASPVKINVGTSTITAVSGGQTHSLALTSTGGLLAWGDNAAGELGTGTAGGTQTTPVAVALGTDKVTAVEAGATYTLALATDGSVRAFGDNTYGELGTATTTSSATPVAVKLPAGASASAIAASDYGLTSFAVVGRIATATTLTSNADAANAGQPVTLTATVTPTDGGGTVSFTSGDSAVPIPGCSTAVLRRVAGVTYRASCSVSTLPVGTTAIGATYAGDALYQGSTASLGGGQVVHAVEGIATNWGHNASGQLGVGTTTVRTRPVVPNLPDATTVVQLTGDSVHSLAITSGGDVYAWGDNSYGELGDGTTTSSKVPVKVGLPTGVVPVAAAAGSGDSLLLTSTGAVYAWGLNTYGELGDGTVVNRTTPQLVGLPTGTVATGISAGLGHSAALTSTGAVYTWGLNNVGQLGVGTTTVNPNPAPVTLPGGATAAGVSAGYAHTLVVTIDGKVLAWGSNIAGELGNGTTTNAKSPVAVAIPADTTVTAVSGGYLDSAAVTSTGAVLTWGYNAYGELGNGGTTSASTPAAISLPGDAVATSVVASATSTYARTAGGAVYAWGDNSAGELGTGTQTSSPTPIAVQLPAGAKAVAIGAGAYGLSGYAIVPRISTGTTVTSAPNPSTFGDTVLFTATVAPTDGNGTVTFTADGSPLCTEVALALTGGDYVATCSVDTLEVGSHAIQAGYAGDTLYQPSSATLAGGQDVHKIATSTSVTSSVPAGQFGTYGSPITFTATVTGTDGGGTVTVASDGVVVAGCGALPLTATATAGTYRATCTSSAVPGGTHAITADYSGDAHYAASSGTLAGGLVVKVATKMVSDPVKISTLLSRPVYRAVLTAQPDGTPIAGATINFVMDVLTPKVQCSAVTDSAGVASCRGPLLINVGTYRGVYAGSDVYLPSVGYSNIALG
jgi:alpha-tubulin suppressor-like RCC1 family protein